MEHSAALLTCIKLPHGFKTFVLSTFELLIKTGTSKENKLQTVTKRTFHTDYSMSKQRSMNVDATSLRAHRRSCNVVYTLLSAGKPDKLFHYCSDNVTKGYIG